MTPNADDGASHNTAIADSAAITRLAAVRVDLVNRSPVLRVRWKTAWPTMKKGARTREGR